MIERGQCVVVMYHYVRDTWKTDFPSIKALAVADFEAQLDWLQERFQVLDYPRFEQALAGQSALDRPGALLTFDDGFQDHYRQAWPILRRRGLGGVFFISGATMSLRPRLLNVHKIHFLLSKLGAGRFAQAVGQGLARLSQGLPQDNDHSRAGIYRYDQRPDLDIKRLLNYELPHGLTDRLLSELFARVLGEEEEFAGGLYLSGEMVREMAHQGQSFGYHTENHRVLSRLDPDGQAAELLGGVDLIRGLTGQPTVPFCYPFGHRHTYDHHTLAILDRAGYATAFNTVRRPADLPSQAVLEIPRLDTKDLPPFKQNWPQ